MAGKVAALVRNFLQTDGDALYLVPGEKIFIMRGTSRTVVGREVVSEGSFHAVVEELVPGVPAETLARKRNRIPYVAGAGLPPVEIQFAALGESPAMMILRQGRGHPESVRPSTPAPTRVPAAGAPPSPADAASAPPAAPPSIVEAPPSIDETRPRPPATPPPAKAEPSSGGLETLLAYARGQGASDLILPAGGRPLLRLEGEVGPAGTAPPSASELAAFLSAHAPERAARRLARAGSAAFTAEVEGVGRCLVRAAREREGTSVDVRLLPAEARRLDALGLPHVASRLAAPGAGLVLVAGPPGSGRTTALAALAAHAAETWGARVVTLEEPVELRVPHGRGAVSQREVGADVPSLRAGLASVASGDADVVLVGTVPDAETAASLVELAASGRLVLVPAAAPSLVLALQTLDLRLAGSRQVELRALLSATFRGGLALALCRARKGGRLVAVESLCPGSLVSELILSGGLATLPDQLREAQGWTPLEASLARLAAGGHVEPREALLRAVDRPGLLARFREAGVPLPEHLPDDLREG